MKMNTDRSKEGTPCFLFTLGFQFRASRVANTPHGPAPHAQTHLEPYGFTDEEIIRLLFGQQKHQQEQKKAAPSKQKPSLDVAKEGGEEQAGQKKKPGGGDEEGKRDGSEGNEGKLVSEAPGRGEGPKVEVEKGEDKEGGRRR